MPEYTHIRCPDCGGEVPQGARCCAKCVVRDAEFALLDTLIAMGYGDTPQDKIDPAIIAAARAHPLTPAGSSLHKALPGPKPVKTPRPPCPRCAGQVKFRCIQRRIGRVYLQCRSCGHQFRESLTPDSKTKEAA